MERAKALSPIEGGLDGPLRASPRIRCRRRSQRLDRRLFRHVLGACRRDAARAMRRVQMRGGARWPHARRTPCTLSVRSRAPYLRRWALIIALAGEERGQQAPRRNRGQHDQAPDPVLGCRNAAHLLSESAQKKGALPDAPAGRPSRRRPEMLRPRATGPLRPHSPSRNRPRCSPSLRVHHGRSSSHPARLHPTCSAARRRPCRGSENHPGLR